MSQLFIQIIAYIFGRVLEEIPGNEHSKLSSKPSDDSSDIKEHVAITILASAAADSAFAIGLLNYIIMKTIIKSRCGVLLSVQGTNVVRI